MPGLGGIGLVLGRLPGDVSTDYAGIGWGRSYFSGFSVGLATFVLKRDERLAPELTIGISYFPLKRAGERIIQGIPIYWDRIGLAAALQNMVLTKTRLGLPLQFNAGMSYEAIPHLFRSYTELQFSKNRNDFILGLETNYFLSTVLRTGIVNFQSEQWLAGFGVRLGSLQLDVVYERFQKRIQFSSIIKFGESPSARAARHYREGRGLLEAKQIGPALSHFRDAAAYEPENGKYQESFQLVKQRYGELKLKEQKLMEQALESEKKGEKLTAFLLFHDVLDEFPRNELAGRKVALLKSRVSQDLEKVKSKVVELYGEENFLTVNNVLDRVYPWFSGDTLLQNYKHRTDEKLKELAEDSFVRGLGYFSQKDLYAAEREFRMARQYSPSFSEIDLYLADVRGRIQARDKEIESLLAEAGKKDELQQYKQATELYGAVLRLDPNNEEARKAIEMLNPRMAAQLSTLFGRAEDAFEKRNFKTAESLCTEILRSNPDNAKARRLLSRSRSARLGLAARYAALGDSALDVEDNRFALEYYTKARDLNPRAVEYKSALERIAENIDWNQKWQEAQSSLARSDFNRAEQLASQLVSMKPERQDIIDFIDQVKTAKDQHITLLLQEGIHFYSEKQYAQAMNKFDELLKIDPNNQTASEYRKRSEEKKRALDSLR
jgi:hypothetical protein